ncbi:MAG: hypothetical protein KF841_07785 [Phycisphaerae bacterium]|nr:hypothetical protein [Phycisphaerae bacterium]
MNSRQKKVLTVLVAGVLILGWRIVVLVQKYAPSEAAAVDVVPAQVDFEARIQRSVQTPKDARLAELVAMQAEVAQHPWGRNPFADVPWIVKNQKSETSQENTQRGAPQAPQIRFVGTSKSGDQWLAAVENGIHRVGDVVQDQFRIVRITRHTLTLESGGWTFTYRAGETAAVVSPRTEEP